MNRLKRTHLALSATLLSVLLLLPEAALAQADDAKPAGGAAIGQVVAATAGAIVVTAVLFYVGYLHRAGRTRILSAIAHQTSRYTGLPGWASLPVQLASLSLICALFGMYWDISLHIDNGRDEGPLANPAHYFILVGLYGIFAAGYLSMVLANERPSRAAVKVAPGWHVPAGGLVLLACSSFSLIGFPLDDVWHRLFGQDVTLWGPTHLMLIGGAGLTLIGTAMLLVEGLRVRASGGEDVEDDADAEEMPLLLRPLKFIERTRYAAMGGGLLIGLSTFQAEFDFGVPQFRLAFAPILIAFAAACALTVVRIYGGRGAALMAVVYYVVIRGGVALLVGPVLGQTTPHMPPYVVEALLVEAVALTLGTQRTYRFGAVCGLLIGTVGFAAEYAWSHVWMPFAWPESLIGEALLPTVVMGVAAGLLGAYIGTALRTAQRPSLGRVPALAPALAALVAVMAVMAWGLDTKAEEGVTVSAQLEESDPRGQTREVEGTFRVDPPSAAEDASWVTATAWQGGGLHNDHLEPTGRPGEYRTTEPLPAGGDWKTILRIHKDDSIAGVRVFLPEDSAIPGPRGREVEVPAAGESRPMVADHEILQREQKEDVAGWLTTAAYLAVLAIVLVFVAMIGWLLRRLASASSGGRERKQAPPRAAPVPA